MRVRKEWIAAIVVVGTAVTASRAFSKQPPGRGFQQQQSGGQYGAAASQLIRGTITGGNAAKGTITISTQNGGSETLAVNTSTQFYTETITTVSALKVGDQVQVHGIPTVMSASMITDGALPQNLTARSYGGGNQQQGGALSQAGSQQATASATGTVSSVSPLAISLGSSATISLTVQSNARVTKVSTMSYSALKEGDQLVASVQQSSNGAIYAQDIGVNLALARQ